MYVNKSIKSDIYKLIILLFFIASGIFPQKNNLIEKRYGSVSYISSQNIYIKFATTDAINIGDTLFYSKGSRTIPAVIVRYISSKSCAGEKIMSEQLKVDDILFANISGPRLKTGLNIIPKDTIKTAARDTIRMAVEPRVKPLKRNYWGRLSIQSMSSFSNTSVMDDQRWRYSFSYSADSILGSSLSFSSYLFFAYNVRNWDYIKNNLGNALKIYDLFIGYPLSKYSKIWFGRYLNPKISNVGSIDGIQYQNQFGKFYFGAVAGSHPSFSDYGYDIKMFEFGGYIGRIDTIGHSQMENTFAFMNQTNNFKTDRRYIYFQHSNNLITNANLFASTEIDLYKVDNGVEKGSFDLTSLFLNLYYTPSRLISFSLSFDARKNAVYYETYKTYLEQILSNELRKGYRAGIYLRPLDDISIGLNGGYSFQSNDPKPARNFGANFYYYEIPLISLSANISYSRLISSYTNGTISGIRFSKYFTSVDLNLAVDYKHIQYEFENGIEPMIQNIGSAEISFKLPFNIYLGLNYEGVFEKQNSWGRVFIDLTKRF